MKILHFFTDDKFIDGAIELFDDLPNIENRYCTLAKKPFKYVRSGKLQTFPVEEVSAMIINVALQDVIVIHGLSSLPCWIIRLIPMKTKVVWFSWGYDVYSNKFPQFPLIRLKRRIRLNSIGWKQNVYLLVKKSKNIIDEFLKHGFSGRTDFIEAVRRIDYYSGVYPIEYDLIKKANPFFRALPIHFNYPSKKSIFEKSKIDDIDLSGKNILVGNSATILGNHKDTFIRLSKLSLQGRKIICPLSYSGMTSYLKFVNQEGKKIFGENFYPLIDFVPISEYAKLINSVSIAIHNIDQQAAVGNILMNLWIGSKVFLPKNSINFTYLKSLGFYLFSIEDDLTQDNVDRYLPKDIILRNRELVIENFSYEVVRDKVIKSFSSIQS